jgi:hypothetical protein
MDAFERMAETNLTPISGESQHDTSTAPGPNVISTLEKINAPAAKAVYTVLRENKIRMVTIQAGSGDNPIKFFLSVVAEHQLPEYQALSYVCK